MLVWEDRWLRKDPLSQNQDLTILRIWATKNIGKFVANYMDTMDQTRSWKHILPLDLALASPTKEVNGWL